MTGKKIKLFYYLRIPEYCKPCQTNFRIPRNYLAHYVLLFPLKIGCRSFTFFPENGFRETAMSTLAKKIHKEEILSFQCKIIESGF